MNRIVVSLGVGFLAYQWGAVAHAVPGVLDPTFGQGGIAADQRGVATSSDILYAVEVQPDGKILAAGYVDSAADWVIVRYDSNGDLDAGFGVGGVVTTPVENDQSNLGLRSDGRIVVAGEIGGEVAVVRLDPDGSLDASFGVGGVAFPGFGNPSSAGGIAVDSSDRVIVTGTLSTAMPGQPRTNLAARYTAAGTIDPTFPVSSYLFASGINTGHTLVKLRSDGTMLFGFGMWSSIIGSYWGAGLVILDSNGCCFDQNGGDPITWQSLDAFFANPSSVAVSADDNVAVTDASDLFLFGVRLLDSSLNEVSSFGTDGFVQLDLGGISSVARAVAFQSDGKMIVAGDVKVSVGDQQFAIVRLNADGTLDTTFGAGGVTISPLDGAGVGRAVGVQPNGRLLVAGSGGLPDPGSGLTIARYGGDSPICGDGNDEPGEECDDGNSLDGDGCSSSCTCESTPDADGDGTSDICDPCTRVDPGRGRLSRPKIVLKRVNTDPTPDNDGVLVKGEFLLPEATSFANLDPVLNGARLVIQAQDGATRVDVTIPAGVYDGASGWRVSGSGRKLSYRDRRKPALINGISKFDVSDRSKKEPNQVKVTIKAKDGTYAVIGGDEPIRVIVGVGEAATGECGETDFTSGDCVFNSSGRVLKCRHVIPF